MSKNILKTIQKESVTKITSLRNKMDITFDIDAPFDKNICVFVCGSLGRMELTSRSDLDLFFIVMDDENYKERPCSNTDTYNFFAKMYTINCDQGFSPPSNGGYYWEFISQHKLKNVGSREEDFTNGFTARMLLLLESKPIFNEPAYDILVNDILNKYFTDYDNHNRDFSPQYLMNDILRYWYTLTLNYEYRRDSNDDNNKKYWKRLKLKFARKLTCFSMIACLYKPCITQNDVASFVKMTPFERLEHVESFVPGVDKIVDDIKKEYEWFLKLRNEEATWWNIKKNKEKAFSHADSFHNLLIHDFMKKVEQTNKDLKEKTDIY